MSYDLLFKIKGGFNLDTLGERLTYLRESNSLSRAQVMKELNIHNLGRFEDNQRKPGIDIVITLADYYGVSIDWLLTGKKNTVTNTTYLNALDDQSEEETTKYIKYAAEMGKRIADIRKDARLSLEDFADEIKCSTKNLEEYETGRQPVPAYVLYNISKAFNIFPSYLLDPDEMIISEYIAIEESNEADYDNIIDGVYEAEDIPEKILTSSNNNFTEFEKNILHFFKKLPKDEQEEISQIIMMKHKKLSKRGQSSAWTNGEDEEAAAKELA